MSAREVIDDLTLRLVRRTGARGYWVRLEPGLRTLGVVYPERSRWNWESSPNAFRGDGRPESARDGEPTDSVPDWLAGSGRKNTRHDACWALVGYLENRAAPALGHGPHPCVGLEQDRKELVDHG